MNLSLIHSFGFRSLEGAHFQYHITVPELQVKRGNQVTTPGVLKEPHLFSAALPEGIPTPPRHCSDNDKRRMVFTF